MGTLPLRALSPGRTSMLRSPRPRGSSWLWTSLRVPCVLLLALALTGCSRYEYRRAASGEPMRVDRVTGRTEVQSRYDNIWRVIPTAEEAEANLAAERKAYVAAAKARVDAAAAIQAATRALTTAEMAGLTIVSASVQPAAKFSLPGDTDRSVPKLILTVSNGTRFTLTAIEARVSYPAAKSQIAVLGSAKSAGPGTVTTFESVVAPSAEEWEIVRVAGYPSK